MLRISKKKLIKVLKGELDEPAISKQTLLNQLAKPVTQEEWLKGYKRWKKHIEEHTISTPLSEYEAIENIGKKRKRRKNVNN
jgi:hypothetical protein|tara:strand:- start:278 stop:523 length:246 start_codon:yes stop_codon:yes gene_type:complete